MKANIWVFVAWTILLPAAHAASFDCGKASTKIEKLICGDATLSKLDDDLAAEYKTAITNNESEQLIPHYQKLWLKERNLCADAACLHRSYLKRIGELKAHYQLMMSNDSRLCNSLLDLYNHDMSAGGRVKYEDHEMFSRILWKEQPPLDITHSLFDINNDGKNELVIKTTFGFHGIQSDQYYIYPADSNVLSTLSAGEGGLKPLFDNPARIFPGHHNDLFKFREIPASQGALIDVYFAINPFIWEGTTYLSITDITPQWIIIAKYINAGETQDICYFYDKNIKHWDVDDIRAQ